MAFSLARLSLHLACASLLCCAALASARNASSARIAVQLWSVKDEVRKDFDGTLARLAALGFQGVEFAGEFGRYAGDGASLKTFLDNTGLHCAGAHVDFAALSPARLDATTRFYKSAGCTTLIIAMDARAATVDGASAVARELTEVSIRLAPLGMRVGYHNHGEEMTGTDGKTPWDAIAVGTPHAVVLQLDIGWTTYAGKDPAALVRRYPGRTLSAHFKAKFAKGESGTSIIGQDKTDWLSVLGAVRSAGGTEWIVLEQEEYPDGMGQLESVAASMQGLQAVLKKVTPP